MARKKNQPIRILTEKELKSTIESVPEERRALASNVVSELIWMSGMLDTLKNKADEIGPLDFFVQGEQSMLRENPALKSYNTTIKNYATLLSKLTDLLPPLTRAISLTVSLRDVMRIDSLSTDLQPGT